MSSLLNRPFLTELDSRAAIKGSRDPLGTQSIWTRFGRHLVGNLTTVSSSVLDFKVLLLGCWFAEQLSDELGSESELATFLKWEQLAAYVRGEWNGDWSFRGTERARKNLSDGTRVTLSDKAEHQILGNQKIYGLWGLYTMPARSSGLLEVDRTRLTDTAREFVESQYVSELEKAAGKGASKILGFLRKPSCTLDVAKDGRVSALEPISRILVRRFRKTERNFYRDSLLFGGPDDRTGGCQRLLAELFQDATYDRDFRWSPGFIRQIEKQARRHGDKGAEVASRLQRIRVCESVLAPSSFAFGHLLGMDSMTLESAVDRLKKNWGAGVPGIDPAAFGELCPEIELTGAGAGARWVAIADALGSGAYSRVVKLLVEVNGQVMASRGGAPWIDVSNDRLHVRFRDERVLLPDRRDLPNVWLFPYFLESLRTVALTLKES